jgi:transcriptional/translational regulatory protein YebC/TACO1
LGTPEQAELVWQPENYIQIDDEQRATSILKLIDTLDNCDDVQGVYGNFEINEDTLKLI